MFTGLVEAVGRVDRVAPVGGDLRLTLSLAGLAGQDIALGDSLAVNGVCLTAVELPPGQFVADVSRESLGCTTLGDWSTGDAVNLELAMRAGGRLGGHLVSGHVDGVGRLCRRSGDGRSERFEFEAPADIARYIAAKGSICIDGASLTVNAVRGNRFEVNLIPHTVAHTIARDYRVGTRVNLEVDVVARYTERLLQASAPASEGAESPLAAAGLVTRGL